MVGADEAAERIVVQDRRDAHVDIRLVLEAVGRVKNGSYCLTGLPLLSKTVRPVPTQRGSTVGASGSPRVERARLRLHL